MKKVLFVVAFLSLAGLARVDAVVVQEDTVKTEKDVNVQVEKMDKAVQDDQCIQEGVSGTFERVNADGTSVKGKINTDNENGNEK